MISQRPYGHHRKKNEVRVEEHNMDRYCAACDRDITPPPFSIIEEPVYIVPGDLGKFVTGQVEHMRELCVQCAYVLLTTA